MTVIPLRFASCINIHRGYTAGEYPGPSICQEMCSSVVSHRSIGAGTSTGEIPYDLLDNCACSSSLPSPGPYVEVKQTGLLAPECIALARTAVESNPPENAMPTGTSLRSLSRTESSSRFENSSISVWVSFLSAGCSG